VIDQQAPGTTAGVICGVIVVAVLGIVLSTTVASATHRAYFSDDDGKTFFVDDIEKIVPFDHDGKPGFRAMVYQCSSNPVRR